MPTPKFKKGRGKTGGREKGVQNKFTTLKQAYLDAFNSKEIGGSDGIVKAFSPNAFTKRDFFRLMSRMLPSNITHDGDVKLTHQLSDKFFPKIDDKKK